MKKAAYKDWNSHIDILKQLHQNFRKDYNGEMRVDFKGAFEAHPEWKTELGADTKDGFNALGFIVRSWAKKGKLNGPITTALPSAVKNAAQRLQGVPGPSPVENLTTAPAEVPWEFKNLSKEAKRVTVNNFARVTKGKDRMPHPVNGIYTCAFRSCDDFGKDFGSAQAALMHMDRLHTKKVKTYKAPKVQAPVAPASPVSANGAQSVTTSNAVAAKLTECPNCGCRFYMVKPVA